MKILSISERGSSCATEIERRIELETLLLPFKDTEEVKMVHVFRKDDICSTFPASSIAILDN